MCTFAHTSYFFFEILSKNLLQGIAIVQKKWYTITWYIIINFT